MSNLEHRIKRLEQQPNAQRGQWPAFLAPYFAGSEYDGHRDAIIASLCGDQPQYTFSEGERYYLITWWNRNTVTQDAPLPPGVRTYPREWDPTVFVLPRDVGESV